MGGNVDPALSTCRPVCQYLPAVHPHARPHSQCVAAGLLKMVEQEGPAVLFRGLKPAFAFQIAVNGTRLGECATGCKGHQEHCLAVQSYAATDGSRDPPAPLKHPHLHLPNTSNPRSGTFIPLKKWLVAHSSMDDFLTSLLAGAGAGCVGAAIGTPFQLIKTRMQVGRGRAAAWARRQFFPDGGCCCCCCWCLLRLRLGWQSGAGLRSPLEQLLNPCCNWLLVMHCRAQAAARAAGPSAVAGAARQPYKGLGDALASIVKSEGKQRWCVGHGVVRSAHLSVLKLAAREGSVIQWGHSLAPAGLFGLYRGAHINMLKIAVASAMQLAVFDGLKARLLRPPPQAQQREQQVGGRAAAVAFDCNSCFGCLAGPPNPHASVAAPCAPCAAQQRGGQLAASAPGRCCAPFCYGRRPGCHRGRAARGCCHHPPLESARCGGGLVLLLLLLLQ